MKNTNYKRYIVWGVTVFTVIALSIILFFVIFKARGVSTALRSLTDILRPIIYGVAMAYILNPIFRRAENLFNKLLAPCFKKPKHVTILSRFLSTALTLAITFIVILGLFYMVLPQLAASVFGLIIKMPDYLTGLETLSRQFLESNPYVGEFVMDIYQTTVTSIQQWLSTDLMPLLASWAAYAYGGLRVAVTTLFNLFVGVIVMVYLLNGKHTFMAQAKKIIYSLMPPRTANLMIENIRYVHRVFGGFINGKLLDSLIIGIICFIFFMITKMPYAMLISVIVGVTNIIPFFGPFLGAVPSAILLLFESPLLCLYFLIFILILQQLDGNVIGPKILGDTTGLPSFWVLFSILLFGGMFGFVGMVLAVPVFALIYSLIRALTDRGLAKRELPTDTDSYRDLHHIEEESLALIKNNEVK